MIWKIRTERKLQKREGIGVGRIRPGPHESAFLTPHNSSLCYTSRPSSIHTKPVKQGHPTTVFCEISVRRSKNCLELSTAWGRLKISRWPFHSRTIFEAYLINVYDYLKFDFSHFTPQIRLFFAEKGNLKVSQSKMRCREESEKPSLS